jgi:hypothetical protein
LKGNHRNQSRDALAAIERVVFQSSEPIVVALTGGWGEGKTHFWKEVVVLSHAGKMPGYVSVFGAESLAVIRERVVVASIGLSKFASAGSGKKWSRAVNSLFTAARAAWNSYGSKFGVSDSIGVELLQTIGLKPGWIICLDDVERLSKKVGFDNFLGYVAELRDKWQLKVVLIYNKEPIDKDAESLFHVYEEKVIDRSIPFALDFADVVKLVFKDVRIPSFDVCEEMLRNSEVLGLRNIRILVKARSYFDEVSQILGADAERDLLREALTALLLFSYTKFSNQKPIGLSFEMLTKHSEWTDRFRKAAGAAEDDAPKSDPTKRLLEQYQYTATGDLDQLLIRFVQTDALDADELRKLHAQYQRDEAKREASKKLRAVFDNLYHGTVRDNPGELCDAFEAAVPPWLPHISPGELDFALYTLSAYGRDTKARQLFDEFKRMRGHVFEKLGPDSMPSGTYAYAPLTDYLQVIAKTREVDQRSIGEVMTSSYADRFISSRDSARLAEFSIDDLVTYLMAHDQPKLTTKLQTLAKEGDSKVRALALGAAEKIAATGSLNRMRMEGMGLLREQNGAGS